MAARSTTSNSHKQAPHSDAAAGSPSAAPAFENDEEMLLAAAQLFEARTASNAEDSTASEDRQRQRHAKLLAQQWHTAAIVNESRSRLCRLMQAEKLNRDERELVVLLVLRELSLSKTRLRDFHDLVRSLRLPQRDIIRLASSISYGRLSNSSLLLACGREDRTSAIPEVSPIVLEAVLAPRRAAAERMPITTEDELSFQLSRLCLACRDKADAFSEIDQGSDWRVSRLPLLSRRLALELLHIEHAIKRHPQWYLAPVFTELSLEPCRLVVLLLAGKEQGVVGAEHELYTGIGLSRAMSKRPDEVGSFMRLLGVRAALLRDGWIQPCGGEDTHIHDSRASLARVEFELTDATMEKLRLARRRSGKTKLGRLLEPRLSIERLILPASARFSLDLALAQARSAKTLLQDWGLGEHIPYGTGITMLFYGPPGTGKTAGAEAVAHAMGKRLLSVDHTKVLNCFLGNTEKNIAQAFELAQRHEAVLFWDEADGMLYERQMAQRSWEISIVNILLQELERFEGVCILATNRQASMDKALERRISLRIEFPFPDRDTRRRLWEVLIPPKMPLAQDVRLNRLAEYELSGGQIKNVVLNVGRIACMRHGKLSATQVDFEQAVQLEQSSRLGTAAGRRIGFAAHHRKRDTSLAQ